MTKRCPEHGCERVLHRRRRRLLPALRARSSSSRPRCRTGTTRRRSWGCPYDCGLCPDHEQHSCLTLVEVTDALQPRVPDLLRGERPAAARRSARSPRSRRMLDAVVANEGEPDVVQISGGEPTLHPEFFAILDAAKARPIRHLMVNTNGIRIAEDPAFARAARDATRRGSRSTSSSTRSSARRSSTLRGADLRAVRERALERLNELQPLDDARRHAEEGPQRRRDRRDPRLRARAAAACAASRSSRSRTPAASRASIRRPTG